MNNYVLISATYNNLRRYSVVPTLNDNCGISIKRQIVYEMSTRWQVTIRSRNTKDNSLVFWRLQFTGCVLCYPIPLGAMRWFNAELTSYTLAQHWTSVLRLLGLTPCQFSPLEGTGRLSTSSACSVYDGSLLFLASVPPLQMISWRFQSQIYPRKIQILTFLYMSIMIPPCTEVVSCSCRVVSNFVVFFCTFLVIVCSSFCCVILSALKWHQKM